MRKIILLVAILAMLLVALAPALAQVSQEQNQDADSGDLNQSSNIVGGGDNSNQCVGLQQAGNTGNAQSQVGVLQYGSEGDVSVKDSGSSIEVSPSNETSCTQSVNQTATATG